jgi:hypothetical protein
MRVSTNMPTKSCTPGEVFGMFGVSEVFGVLGVSGDVVFSSILHRACEQPRFVPAESSRDGTGAEREAGNSGESGRK